MSSKHGQQQERPRYGELDGKRVLLSEAEKLDKWSRARVVVDLPGIGKVRPWRFVD
ncbi:MAG: hypothetical protein ACE5FA_11245 [Dehalococcoidia bacterium]